MQQRRVRLGDILDDYCPRERRVTNHVVAAMVGDDVKHTRCTTCDVDHEYKHARIPPARKKKDGVLATPPGDAAHLRQTPVRQSADEAELPEDADTLELVEATTVFIVEAAGGDDPTDGAASVTVEAAGPARDEDEGPVHRRLIRATFPRPEGQVPEWKEPDFTVRQDPRGDREVDGNRAPGAGGGGGRHRRRGRGGAFGRPDGQRGGNRGQGGGNQWGQGGTGQGHGFRQHGGGNRQGHGASPRGPRPQGQPNGPRPAGSGRKRGR